MNFFTILWIIWFLSEILLAKMMRSKEPDNLDKSTLKIIWVTIVVSVTTGIILTRTDFSLTNDFYDLLYYSGIFLIIIGLIIRWFSIIELKKSFTVNVSISKDQDIIQSGLYKYVRHPSYAGSLLSFLGLGIVYNNWLSLVCIFLPILAAFLYRIHVEEMVLHNAFGIKYETYTRNTWRLFPKVY